MVTKKDATGQTCVGDLRLSALDVGFDMRDTGHIVQLPENFNSVGLDIGPKTYLVTGTRDEMIATIKGAGYTISEHNLA